MLEEELGLFVEHFDPRVCVGLSEGGCVAAGTPLVALVMLLPAGTFSAALAASRNGRTKWRPNFCKENPKMRQVFIFPRIML